MDGTTAVWLGLTLAAPLTLVPEIALLRLLHSRRSGWHPLDVLIVSLLVGQLCCTIVTLGLSATALARHAGLLLGSDSFIPELLHQHRTPLCAALISFWAAAHTLHAATLTSMAVDRAMTVRWPYKYRVSVRRTQIRYHVVVLAVVSLLVGVATLFATSNTSPFLAFNQQPPPPPSPAIINHNNLTDNLQDGGALVQVPMPEWTCAFLPYTFDSRFSLFWLGLHGLLLLTTLTAAAVILITRIMIRFSSGFSGRLGLAGGSGSDMRTLGNASDGSSATLPLPSSSSIERPTLPAPPPPPRYTPGPVACLSGHGTASVSPLTRSSHPASMFGSTDKTFINLLHHEAGLLSNNSNNNNNMNNKSGHVVADFSSSAEMLDYVGCCGGGSWNRQRHSTVAAVLIVAYLTHHLPLLVLTTLGTFFVEILPVGWPFSAIILGLTLASGLLFMTVLVFIDPVLYTWMIDSLKPSSRGRGQRLRHHHHLRSPVTSESATLEANLAPMKIDEETRYRMSQIYCQEPTEAKFPLTNGSLFVHLMNPSSADGQRANRRPSRMGVSAYDHRPQQQQQQQQQRSSSVAVMSAHIPEQLVPYPEAAKPPLMTFMSRARILAASNGSLKSTDTDRHCATATNSNSLMEPFYCDPLTTGIGAPPSFADVDVAPIHHNPPVSNTAKFRQEPIYASLSETLSSCHTLDSLGGRLAVDDESPLRVERKDVVQLEEEEEEDDEGSATESAGDDFEFHNIRTSRQTLITSPSSSSTSSSSNAPPTCNEAIFGLEDLRPRSRVARSATYRILCNGLDVKCTGKHDKGNQEIGQQQTSAAAAVAATSQSRHGIVTCVTIRIGQQEEEDLEQAFGETSSSLRRSKLLTSLSMNDIDVIGQDDGDQDDNDGMAELAVPARSDSLFSLYVAPDTATTPVVPQQQQLYSSITSSSRLTNQDTRRQPQQQQQQHQTGVFNLRKKSSHRSRAAVLQRFQQRSRRGKDDFKSGHVVSIAALKAALASQSPMSYLDTGDLFYSPSSSLASQQQSKTVFVSDYI